MKPRQSTYLPTHHRGQPIRKRCSQHRSYNRHLAQQLRLLAPKDKELPETPVQQHQQATEGADSVSDVNIQQPAASQSHAYFVPASSGHGFTSSSLLQCDHHHTLSSLERKQDSAVAPSTRIYFDRGPSSTSYGGSPALECENLVWGGGANGSVGPSTQQLSYGNLQLQGTIDYQHSGGYWMPPMIHAPENAVWTAKAQPTIGVHRGQCSICSIRLHTMVK